MAMILLVLGGDQRKCHLSTPDTLTDGIPVALTQIPLAFAEKKPVFRHKIPTFATHL
jgi:hypothetical protein